jgi:hypothetical protein
MTCLVRILQDASKLRTKSRLFLSIAASIVEEDSTVVAFSQLLRQRAAGSRFNLEIVTAQILSGRLVAFCRIGFFAAVCANCSPLLHKSRPQLSLTTYPSLNSIHLASVALSSAYMLTNFFN